MVSDPLVHVAKSRVYHQCLHAHALGADGIGHDNYCSTGILFGAAGCHDGMGRGLHLFHAIGCLHAIKSYRQEILWSG